MWARQLTGFAAGMLQVKGAGLQEEQIAYICAESLKVCLFAQGQF